MALKYKLVEKSTDPRDKEAPKNWYAVPQSESAMDVKDMTHEATKGSTLARRGWTCWQTLCLRSCCKGTRWSSPAWAASV